MRARSPALIIVLCLGSMSCTTAALRLPDPILSPLSHEDTREAVLSGMARRGWIVEEEEDARLLARLDRRRHVAKVWINFSGGRIRFSYGGSHALRCREDGATCSRIHRNYNKWTRNLAIDISREISSRR